MNTTDIAIVGGGTVGSVLAMGIARQTPYSVTVIDANPLGPAHDHVGFDARVIALARRTVNELAGLGVQVRSAGSTPIEHIQVSEKGGAGMCELHARDYRLSAFGEVVSLTQLGRLLNAHLDELPVQRLHENTVTAAERDTDGVTLTLGQAPAVKARLVIMADGGRSELAPQLGFTRTEQHYDQIALVCNVTTSQPHHQRAYERFTADGPLALLPFGGHAVSPKHAFSVVWTVDAAHADALLSLPDEAFLARLQQEFGYRQGTFCSTGPRHSYPLALRQTTQLVNHRAAVLGNAAQTLHPIAGQGFNLGLRDVMALLQCLNEADDPGAFGLLRQYAQARQADVQSTIWLTDSLVRGFSNRLTGLKAARNLGLIGLNHNAAARRIFVRRTTGYGPATTKD